MDHPNRNNAQFFLHCVEIWRDSGDQILAPVQRVLIWNYFIAARNITEDNAISLFWHKLLNVVN